MPTSLFRSISVLQVEPFLMKKENTTGLVGNDQYEGFTKDYLDALGELMNVDIQLSISDDYGQLEAGKWTGAIGDVVYEARKALVS